MAYIRNKREERTGYQEHNAFIPSIDFQCDFVMVYGMDASMPERVKKFRDAGYVVHLMTGIAWGAYQDYLRGDWDGVPHEDEAQMDRQGQTVIHGPAVPYMVPTVAFSDYLAQKLKTAVDCGVEAIHMEEPEFWDHSGYSEAFQREYEIRYHKPFQPQHQSAGAHWRCAKLKAELYARAVRRVSETVKEYAKTRYGRDLRFYVPTHSLLNYTQWKIMSPEASLIGIPTVDGYIAQVWTGTSRVANVYEGDYRERTFETAFLEYGVMQELSRGTGRRMWFLHDPIEDNPAFTWEDYRRDYQKTLIASLLHPLVSHYEICPWPARVFEGRYPRVQPRIEKKDETSFAAEGSRTIPDAYRTFLASMFQMLGDMDQTDWAYESAAEPVGLFLSDTCLYQRTYPETVPTAEEFQEKLYSAIIRHPEEEGEKAPRFRELIDGIAQDEAKMNAFVTCSAFPCFYGLALPLLKYGLPLLPVQLDNVRLFPGYLDGFRFLILSYEMMKPLSPDIHLSLAEWVQAGGCLIYAGDGSDPFHNLRSWWRDAGYAHPAQHLFSLLGLPREPESGVYPCGMGRVTIYRLNPARICLSKEQADSWRETVKEALNAGGVSWQYDNHITLRRGPYIISQVMAESVHDRARQFTGHFADLMADGFPIVHEKTVCPDEGALLYDLDRLPQDSFAIIGTAARISDWQTDENVLRFTAQAADKVLVQIRLRLPFAPSAVSAHTESGPKDVPWRYDPESRTILLTFRSNGKAVCVAIK